MTLTRAERLALITTILAVAHHVDHILRVDHSGWPFRPGVTPFTFTLLIYPVIAVIFLARERPRLRTVLAGLLAVLPTLAHLTLETPVHQYRTWAAHPETNLPGVTSPMMGSAAVIITVLLSLFALLTFLAFRREEGR